jgi:hypothetical protein
MVSRAAYVGSGKQAEDIVGGFGELPELPITVSNKGGPAELRGSQDGLRTEVQYGSSAAILRSPLSLKMPFLKTSFESLAPILAATR